MACHKNGKETILCGSQASYAERRKEMPASADVVMATKHYWETGSTDKQTDIGKRMMGRMCEDSDWLAAVSKSHLQVFIRLEDNTAHKNKVYVSLNQAVCNSAQQAGRVKSTVELNLTSPAAGVEKYGKSPHHNNAMRVKI